LFEAIRQGQIFLSKKPNKPDACDAWQRAWSATLAIKN
jgi:hypothetical protein